MTQSTPASDNAFDSALQWLQTTLLGTAAVSIAIIAIAILGLMLMSGRLPTRRAIEVVLGCFIVFGASSIASGLMQAFTSGESQQPDVNSQPLPGPIIAAPAAPAVPYDPYAGASVPAR